MAGYDWTAGKSNNAVAAEAAGLIVKSKITAKWLKTNGIDESPSFIRWLIDERVIPYEEWHHTSKFFNRTYYYSAATIREELAVRAAAPASMGGSLEWLRQRFTAANQ